MDFEVKRVVQCPYCSESFDPDGREEVLEHVLDVHADLPGESMVVCGDCGEEFHSEHGLKIHRGSQHR